MANEVQKIFMFALLLLNLSLVTAAQGTQFITGPCTSDADCASGCCGFNSGKCAGPVIAQERDGGCGFGNPQPNNNAALSFLGQQPTTIVTQTSPVSAQAPAITAQAVTPDMTAPAVTPTPSSGAGNGAGNGAGKQFITGPCKSDADCASACCGFNTGLCAGPVIAQERDGGCGFGNPQPNANAAKALTGQRRRRRALQG